LKTQREAHGRGNSVIFQIAGYQNSGKTTFLTKLINRLTEENWKVGTIKHHGHGGKPSLPDKKDSGRHIEAGAFASLVEGEGRMLLQAEQMSQFSLEDQITLLSFFELDLILIEGHKQADFPKAVLLKDKKDEELLTKLKNIIAVFYWEEQADCSYIANIPQFHINDEKGLQWIEDYLITMRADTFFE
jgi:molybdopterin-guanine dinucleotide biosynthesis adapter protein